METVTNPTHHVNIHDLELDEPSTYFSGSQEECAKFLATLEEKFPELWEEAELYEFPAPCISETRIPGESGVIRQVRQDYTITYAHEDDEPEDDRCYFAPCTGHVFQPGEKVFLLQFHPHNPGGWTIASLDLCRRGYYQLGDTHTYRNDF